MVDILYGDGTLTGAADTGDIWAAAMEGPDSLQTGLDAVTAANGTDIYLKHDFTLSDMGTPAAIDLDAGGGTIATGKLMRVRGCKAATTAEPPTASDLLPRGEYVTVDADGGAHRCMVINDTVYNVLFEHIRWTNTALAAGQEAVRIEDTGPYPNNFFWYGCRMDHARHGVVFDSDGGLFTFVDCEMDNNAAIGVSHTAALYGGLAIYFNCRIHDNATHGCSTMRNTMFVNCVFYANAVNNVLCRNGGKVTLLGCVLDGGTYGIATDNATAQVYAANCIISNGSTKCVQQGANGTIALHNCCIWGSPGGDSYYDLGGNVTIDPGYPDRAGEDFRVTNRQCLALVDAGGRQPLLGAIAPLLGGGMNIRTQGRFLSGSGWRP